MRGKMTGVIGVIATAGIWGIAVTGPVGSLLADDHGPSGATARVVLADDHGPSVAPLDDHGPSVASASGPLNDDHGPSVASASGPLNDDHGPSVVRRSPVLQAA
jgi:hypothetical protein